MTDGSYGSPVSPYEPLTFAPVGGNITVYTFPLPEKAPQSLRLNTEGDDNGDISLLAVIPGSPPALTLCSPAAAIRAKYNSGTGEITISGTLSQDVAAKYGGSKIYICPRLMAEQRLCNAYSALSRRIGRGRRDLFGKAAYRRIYDQKNLRR